jgi:hypothetical protein
MNLGRKVALTEIGLPETKAFPDLGLRFSPSWRDTIEAVTALWRNDLERRQFIIGSVFSAGAYATSAIRWLTAPPGEISLPAHPARRVGQADIEAIQEVTRTFLRLDNLFGGGRARPTVLRWLGCAGGRAGTG